MKTRAKSRLTATSFYYNESYHVKGTRYVIVPGYVDGKRVYFLETHAYGITGPMTESRTFTSISKLKSEI